MGFLIQVTLNTDKQQRNRTCRSAAAKIVLKEAVTQALGAYIDKRQVTVEDLVMLRPIFEVYNMETG